MGASSGRPPARGIGLLLTTESAYVELGTHHGRRLRGRAERRLLRLALGTRTGLRVTLSRVRPVALDVTEDAAGGRATYELPLRPPPDPWAQAAGRLALLWLLSRAVVAVLGTPARADGEPPAMNHPSWE